MGSTGTSAGPISASRLDKIGFTDQGGGQWTLDTGMGGGQILDETGTSRDPAMGFGGKVYSATAWDSNYTVLMDGDAFTSLNAAKQAIKDAIKDTL